ncbi:hypothetical protein DL771_003576 [Monosporascus sp. 5C6A]|nr:hypothetical protein DL771_003576 [Monosporascus sp. 5C6A]
MYSYGGVMGTNAVAGLARRDRQENLNGGVVHLIYAAFFMLLEVQSIRKLYERAASQGRTRSSSSKTMAHGSQPILSGSSVTIWNPLTRNVTAV